MPLGFLNYKDVLDTLIIPDLSNIIISYTSHCIDIFDEKFISKCIKTGHYLYYNKDETTLIHYLFEKKRYEDIKILLKNSNYLRAKHFQNKDKDGKTELSWLCGLKMHSTIDLVEDWKPEHFQNKDKDGNTELSLLCHNGTHETIDLVKDWKPEHFQNKSNTGRTELYWLCCENMHKTIALATSNFVGGDRWKPEHFQNKNNKGETELSWLCYRKMHGTIAIIKDWKPEHFQNKDEYGRTELYWLCRREMHETIALIKDWEPEHCNSNTERNYMKSINAFVKEPVVEKKEEYIMVVNKKEEIKFKTNDSIIEFVKKFNKENILGATIKITFE